MIGSTAGNHASTTEGTISYDSVSDTFEGYANGSWVTLGSTGGGYDTIEDEATPLTQRTTINFTGAGVTATDSGGKTVVTIPGGGGGAYGNQAEVDWGANATNECFKEFVIVDASLTGSEYIIAQVAYEAPTGKDVDELEFDAFVCMCSPAVGQFRLAMHSLLGPAHGTFKINYIIGTP